MRLLGFSYSEKMTSCFRYTGFEYRLLQARIVGTILHHLYDCGRYSVLLRLFSKTTAFMLKLSYR